MAQIDPLLRNLRENGGSDLHLACGVEPRMRVHGALRAVDGYALLTNDSLRKLMHEITSPDQWREYEETHDLDFAYGLEGIARFRANYFVQERGAGAVFRIIPEKIVPLDALNLPDAIEQLAHTQKGLVLVTGPTGSGKSTTLAAIIDKINDSYAKHIVTIEDPVEFVHQNKKSTFSHREVGPHTRGFAEALRAAIRQNADVILVGEMRDYETISLAITAAEMGTLVFGTLHTNGAVKTIDRIIDSFPADEQPQARISLSESLAGVVSQLLLPTTDGKGRCAVNEILLKTPALPNVIREANTSMLSSIIQSGKSMGMQTMDDALAAMVEDERISAQDAYQKATDKARFEALLRD
ncbi:MAG: type IV pilus twitching motility protein PilT [Deltaproteobacteria bacterium]|nr:MAG: type IV pilus twitching motility protein PilT [Deltaproteobacteria bacterium]TDJ05787.1 MAG: type IV pilus twitching motility protein PilT [Deltaproteobacteria bacterium]